MKKTLKSIVICSLLSTLVACGGGGGGGGDDKKNTIPTLNVVGSFQIDESFSTTINYSTSDKDGDSVKVTASSSSELLSVNVVDSTSLMLTSSSTDIDVVATLTITGSDGKGGVVTKEINVTIVNTDNMNTNNTQPIIENLPESINVYESSPLAIPFYAYDNEEDILTYSITSSSDLITASVDNNLINIQTKEVSRDTIVVLTLQVSDNNITVEKLISVNVLNNLNDGTYSEFELSWEDPELAELFVIQGSDATYPFKITNNSVDLARITYSAELTLVEGSESQTVPFTIDIKSQSLIVLPRENSRGTFSGTLTVFDGITTKTLDFTVVVGFSVQTAVLDLSRILFFEENVPRTFDLFSSSSLSPDTVFIDEVNGGIFVSQGDESKISISYDNENQTFTIHPKTGSSFNKFQVRINVADSYGSNSGASYSIYVKGSKSALEQQLEEQLILTQNYIKSSNEYNILANFIINALELNGDLTIKEAFIHKSLIADTRAFIATEIEPSMNCISETLKSGVPKLYKSFVEYDQSIGDFVYTYGLICLKEETSSETNLTSNHYQDENNYNVAMTELKSFENKAQQNTTIVNGSSLFSMINDLSNTLELSTDFNLGDIEYSEMIEMSTEKYSRFYGNPSYGSFINSTWVWSDNYRILGTIVNISNEVN